MAKASYDGFSTDYDRFVNWKERLLVEMPFIQEQLLIIQSGTDHPLRILDAACGTGMHAIALAKEGSEMSGADISPEMIKKAQKNTRAAQVNVDLKPVGFGDLEQAYMNSNFHPFDVLICLGNSLPHLLSPDEILAALKDMAACLRPGGMLLLQNRNFDAVMAEHNRWQGLQSYKEGSQEWLFLRFYDFDPDGLITFNIFRLHKGENEIWTQKVSTTRLFPLKQEILLPLLEKAGFHQLSCFGKMEASMFDPEKSGNLVVTAIKN
ncbi:MAG: class I SAM-dependent methyltransferase [Pelolinea sp.]|nr:class I SAM-dependent methyltransferase [Pelolinea sp.]